MLKWRYDEMRRMISATELGVARALVAGFGGKKVKDLPEFEEVTRPKRTVLPAWMAKFEEVNKGRVIQTG